VQFVVGTPGQQQPAPQITPVQAPAQQQQQQTGQQYWAKGTGFGTGSTAQTWDLDGAMHRQRQQEEQATCLLQTLAAYIYPQKGQHQVELPVELLTIVQSSHLVSAICSYLRNDSVMDMARHVPLYKALLLLLRSVAACPQLVPLLLPNTTASSSSSSSSNGQSIHSLLHKLKNYVSSYTARLASVQNRAAAASGNVASIQQQQAQEQDSDSEEGIADLSKDICTTWALAKAVALQHAGHLAADQQLKDETDGKSHSSSSAKLLLLLASGDGVACSTDKLYCDIMQPLQFGKLQIKTDLISS